MSRPRRAIEGSRSPFGGGAAAASPRRGIARPTLHDRIRPLKLPLAATATAGALFLAPHAAATFSAPVVAVPAADADYVALSDVRTSAVTSPVSVPTADAAAEKAAARQAAAEVAAAQKLAAEKAALAQSAAKAAAEKAAAQKAAADKLAAEKAAAAKAAAAERERAEEAAAAERAAEERAAEERAAEQKAAARKATAAPTPTRTQTTAVRKSSGSYAPASNYGLRGGAVAVYEAVMSRFSGINSVGGYRASSLSNHQLGLAIDFMITPGSESGLGWSIAKYLVANADAFNIDHVIFEQKIWSTYSPYWRSMEDRGSTTANHYDHVHVSVKG